MAVTAYASSRSLRLRRISGIVDLKSLGSLPTHSHICMCMEEESLNTVPFSLVGVLPLSNTWSFTTVICRTVNRNVWCSPLELTSLLSLLCHNSLEVYRDAEHHVQVYGTCLRRHRFLL